MASAKALALGVAIAAFCTPALAQQGRHIVEVTGVGASDMLKLRAGPGTGFRVIVGLPDGTELIDRGCDQVGGTPWCKVALREVPRLNGYVSGHYLKRR